MRAVGYSAAFLVSALMWYGIFKVLGWCITEGIRLGSPMCEAMV